VTARIGQALVAGATGVVGRNLLAHLLQRGERSVLALSRRKPDLVGDFVHLPVDLLSPDDCRAKAPALREVTHVFFAAYVERPETAAWVADNAEMLRNLVEVVDHAAPRLQHIHVVHGTKWYGNHLGPFKTPAKEDDPRHMPPNFYYDQWDYLVERQSGSRWTFSAARPHAVSGFVIGNPMNLPMVIGVYAAISKELGLPLCHPGTPGNYHALYQCTDAELLAKAMVWMATEPRCANQAFNITNGDLIRWENLWPRIARYFHLEPGPRRQLSLAKFMADKGPVWDRIVHKHGLKPYRYEEVVSWPYGDFVFTPEFDIVSDTGKSRRFGFHEFVDTEEMFFRIWDQYRAARVLPGLD
jgi:nucleoside-diphosphate-sugar epimerase